MQQVANRRRSTWLPPDCFRGPVVLLDSGRSLAESHFAERMRKWLLDELASRPSSRARHNCYLAYPDEKAMFRYGAFPTSEYDEYEVRPIRTGGRALDPGGVFATMAAFEEGCHWEGIPAPWRKNNKKQRRATVVYLNPSKRDWKWALKHQEKWHHWRNIPSLHVGLFGLEKTLPYGFQRIVSHVWVLSDEDRDRIAATMGKEYVTKLPWERWWEPQETPKHEFGIACNWRDTGCIRVPDMALDWLQVLCLDDKAGPGQPVNLPFADDDLGGFPPVRWACRQKLSSQRVSEDQSISGETAWCERLCSGWDMADGPSSKGHHFSTAIP